MKVGPFEFRVHKGSDQIAPVNAMNPPSFVEQAMISQGMDMGNVFGPGRPLNPWEGYGTEPRAFDYPMAINVVTRPRLGRMDFYSIATLNDSWDVARMCIQHRIRSFQSFDWSIVPSFDASDLPGEVVDAEIAEAYRRMRRPDGRTPYKNWIAKLVGQIFEYDAPALWKRRDLSGRPIALEVVDGTTIAPLLDRLGHPPEGDAPAYIQFIKGMPWDWISQRDMIYEPFSPQPNSPYGRAPIEDVVLIANADIRMTMHLLEYWTEGNIPGGLMTAPPDVVDPKQVDERQKRFNARVLSDAAAKVQVHYVEHGTGYIPIRTSAFDEAAYLWGFRKGCATYGVTPQDLGITLDVNRANGETQVDIQERIGDRPLALHVDQMVTSYLRDDVGLHVEFQTSLGAEKEDRLNEARVWQIYIQSGIASPDEARSELTGLPVDSERPIPRMFFSPRTGVIPISSALAIAGPSDPDTGAPAESQPLSTTPFSGVPGLLPDKSPGGTVFQRAPINPDDPNFPANEGIVPGTDTVTPAPVQASLLPVRKDEDSAVGVAGLVVRAADTGRVLMLQRAMAENDHAAGMWEWPGGHLEESESPWDGAWREWQEETGCSVPDGQFVGDWRVGSYRGFVWEIPSEDDVSINQSAGRVLNPEDPDGDQIETVAWFRPSQIKGMPALRPEVGTTDWDVVSGFPVAKAETAGVSVATGIEGVDLHGLKVEPEEDEEELPEPVAKELRRWRDNARTRVRAGRRPRPFASDVLTADQIRPIWDALSDARTREQVDAAFRVRKAGTGPKAGAWPETRPGHELLNRILDHYAPLIQEAIAQGITGVDEAAAEYAALYPVQKSASTTARQAARALLQTALKISPGPLQKVLASLTQDTFLAGAQVASQVSGQPPLASLSSFVSSTDWDSWKPGWPQAAEGLNDPGLASILADQDIAIQGILGSVTDQIGTQLADSLAQGDSVQMAAKGIADFLGGDMQRSYLVADTEMARAMGAASMSTYQQNGVEYVEWLVAGDPCDICQGNADGGVVQTGDDFPSGDSTEPAHPRCRCAVAPARAPKTDDQEGDK